MNYNLGLGDVGVSFFHLMDTLLYLAAYHILMVYDFCSLHRFYGVPIIDEAISDALDEYVTAMIEYLVEDKSITMRGDDIVKHDENERLN